MVIFMDAVQELKNEVARLKALLEAQQKENIDFRLETFRRERTFNGLLDDYEAELAELKSKLSV